VWDILQKSYEKIGGIHGSGFKSKQDMIDNIPFWKLYRLKDVIKTVVMYKDKDGRKPVAMGHDSSSEGRSMMNTFINNELELGRSYTETSSNALFVIIKQLSDNFIDYVIPIDKALEKLTGEDISLDKKYKDEFISEFDDRKRFSKVLKN
jgi:hypothetical protein